VERGIQIIEMLSLEDLSQDKVYDFVFIALPLRIKGGTGSPIRPIAIR
jgi:kynurenine formamidase